MATKIDWETTRDALREAINSAALASYEGRIRAALNQLEAAGGAYESGGYTRVFVVTEDEARRSQAANSAALVQAAAYDAQRETSLRRADRAGRAAAIVLSLTPSPAWVELDLGSIGVDAAIQELGARVVTLEGIDPTNEFVQFTEDLFHVAAAYLRNERRPTIPSVLTAETTIGPTTAQQQPLVDALNDALAVALGYLIYLTL
jgi:hypothetical protein